MRYQKNRELAIPGVPAKKWTILIYANGNNELEPEMRQTVAKLEKISTSEDINVIVQLGRAKTELVKILRPDLTLKHGEQHGSGVRRYCVDAGTSTLLQSLGEKNMADPKTLYEFLKWGMQHYPAKQYMVILSGHGFQFVGVLTDYSQKAPYIMGIPEMVRAINEAANDTGNKIDLLILDVCYFNFLESIYELGKEEKHAVQNVITYVFNGPLQGLPYDEIIQVLKQMAFSSDVQEIVKKLIHAIAFDLVAFEINHGKLEAIKSLFNELALLYWRSNPDKKDAHLSHLLFSKNPLDNWYNLAQKTLSEMLSTVICARGHAETRKPPINVANVTTSDVVLLSSYYRLGFAQNNYWTYLLSNKTFNVNAPIQSKRELRPLKLKPLDVYTYISVMNPGMAKDRKDQMLVELFRYKKWSV